MKEKQLEDLQKRRQNLIDQSQRGLGRFAPQSLFSFSDPNFQEGKQMFIKDFDDLINQRSKGKPIAYLTKKKSFWKDTFEITNDVLIPRPDTEIIIEEVLKLTKNKRNYKILDIGVGSGCVLLSLLREKKNFTGVGIDISRKCIDLCRKNSLKLGLNKKVKLFNSDVDNFNYGKYDLIVSNPPYIKSCDLKFEKETLNDFKPVSINRYDMALNKQVKNWKESRKFKIHLKKYNYSDLPMQHTAHLTTSDKYGNVVSLTQTLGPNMGSRVATKGLGFLYNVTMGPYLGGYLGEDKPGDRASSHISPTLFTKNKEVILALGAAGGNKIPVAINQVAYRYLKQKFPLNDALFMPRVYMFESPRYVESHLGIHRINDDILYESYYNVEKIREKAYFGRVHAVALDTINNKWIGSADPDWEGSVSSFE